MQIILAVLPVLIMYLLILNLSGNNFTYSLDDPYIHLTLARNILHGTYGINLGEYAAPSSSILWPFLLAPFSILGDFFEYIPLIINFLCIAGLAYCIFLAFSEIKFIHRVVLIFLILLSLNAYGLAFTGMEHNLQLLLVAMIILPFLRNQSEETTPFYQILAIILLPLVRYEGMAISLPVILTLYAKGDKKTAITTAMVLFGVVGGFSLFLYSHDLGFLPSSVLAKTTRNGIFSFLGSVITNQEEYGFLIIPVSIVVSLLWKKSRFWAIAVLLATFLHYTFGKNGWYGRYETYYLLFFILISIRVALNYSLNIFPHVLFLPLMFLGLIECTTGTPLAASNINNEQAQTAAIARMLGEPVAVNDLGLVSLRSGSYVLDLWGLGSIEALNYRKNFVDENWTESLLNKSPHKNKDSSNWIELLMNKKNVKYAFVYDEWFPAKPASWIKVGMLNLLQKTIIINPHVALYATDAKAAEKLRAVLYVFSSQNKSSLVEIVINDENRRNQWQ